MWRILALILVVGGILGLVYGSFTYTKSSHTTEIGPVAVSVKDNRTVQIPIGVGVAALIAGVALLAFGPKRA